MQFKHPEILYALFLLVIPVLVHLFQLRKFRTEKFTNVKFLKKAVLQTRKSSRLKKWLILCTRLLLLACLIIAFAQPFFPSEAGITKGRETVIYLDNSYSMQARGKNGVLLKRAVQELLENLPQKAQLSLFTNEEEFKALEPALLRKKLQQLDYSAGQLDWETVGLKAADEFSEGPHLQKDFIVISDLQKRKNSDLPEVEGAKTFLVRLKPEDVSNISLDTAYLTSKMLDETKLELKMSFLGVDPGQVPVAVFDGQNLLAKKSVALEEDSTATVDFSFPAGPILNGRIQIDDNGLSYDNQLFFSINKTQPVKVVIIGDEEADFLKRIYKAPEFELSSFSLSNIGYKELSQANLVVLNEPKKIPSSLVNTLQKLHSEDVFLVIIPSEEAVPQEYNELLRSLRLPLLKEKTLQEKLVTKIAFSNPLYEGVFDEKVRNFQYPKVNSYFPVTYSANRVLSFENNEPFLLEKDHVYLFSAALNEQNSNFKNSPLIVPTLYNIGNMTISPSQLYFQLGKSQEISLNAFLEKDEILKLSFSEDVFIPRQQSFQNKVKLYLEDLPSAAGQYRVLRDSAALRQLSFNYNRAESELKYAAPKTSEKVKIRSTVPDVFDEIESAGEVDLLWKWFVIFALIFLLTEMLILKFFK
ncbi:MAG: BatA domain-containing protein [Salinimicrobium sp.]